MASGGATGPLHPEVTNRRHYRYLFYTKHHGQGDDEDAQWSEDLSQQEEFGIFNRADELDLSDDRGHLYGLRIGPEREILMLGTWGQQVAEFPFTREGEAWHGYPLYPLKKAGPPNRRGERSRPPKAVFLKMENAKLLSPPQRKRLQKGDNV